MNVRLQVAASVGLMGALSGVVACSAPPDGALESLRSTQAPIMGGREATAYPEAALVDEYRQGQMFAMCSGGIIAPQVVLTAGHCVAGEASLGVPDSWVVTAPYSGKQSSKSSGSAVYDFVLSQTVDPSTHDIGLIFLTSPITLSQYPTLAASPLPAGTQVINIGRTDNGTPSRTSLFVGPPVAVQNGSQTGYPNDYSANDVVQPGDSGGPTEVPNATPHEIVAVNSGNSSDEIMARVDLLHSWIEQQIQSHGGGGITTPADAGGRSGGPGGSGGGGVDAGESPHDDGDGGNANGVTGGWGTQNAGGSCSAAAPARDSHGFALVAALAFAAMASRRRGAKNGEPSAAKASEPACCKARHPGTTQAPG